MKNRINILIISILSGFLVIGCNNYLTNEELLERYYSYVTHQDIVYKSVNEQDLTLDILMPTQAVYEPIPLIVYIHGGGFTGGDKANAVNNTRGKTTPQLLNLGYAVVSVEYMLCDGTNVFPQNIIDVKDSLRWIYKNAETYNFDTQNIGVWGGSAGGHLAMMVAYTHVDDFSGVAELEAYSSQVNYVVNINGPTDLLAFLELEPEAAEKKSKVLMGKDFDINSLTEAETNLINSYSPLYHIDAQTVPTIIFHGTEDVTVPISQSNLLEAKLKENGCEVSYIVIEGAGHGLTPSTEAELKMVTDETIKFIQRHTN